MTDQVVRNGAVRVRLKRAPSVQDLFTEYGSDPVHVDSLVVHVAQDGPKLLVNDRQLGHRNVAELDADGRDGVLGDARRDLIQIKRDCLSDISYAWIVICNNWSGVLKYWFYEAFCDPSSNEI